MQSSGERSYGGGYRGIGIRKRRGRNARRKAGSVKLVLRVDNKEFVHDDNVLRLRFRIAGQLRKHPVRVRGVTARKRCWLTFRCASNAPRMRGNCATKPKAAWRHSSSVGSV